MKKVEKQLGVEKDFLIEKWAAQKMVVEYKIGTLTLQNCWKNISIRLAVSALLFLHMVNSFIILCPDYF